MAVKVTQQTVELKCKQIKKQSIEYVSINICSVCLDYADVSVFTDISYKVLFVPIPNYNTCEIVKEMTVNRFYLENFLCEINCKYKSVNNRS